MNIEQERADLLPCPFCGESKSLIVQHREGTIIHPAYRIYCGNCGASSGYADRVDPAKYWNSRAALQSQDREDAEWMTCESRRPYVVNSLKHIAKELRDAERRSRNRFKKKSLMGEPARYFADACGEAAALLEAKLEAIDHARRVEEGWDG